MKRFVLVAMLIAATHAAQAAPKSIEDWGRSNVPAPVAPTKPVAPSSAAMARIQTASVQEIEKDKSLLAVAMEGGKTAFEARCESCHEAGGIGNPGVAPNLVDDHWLWGGTLEEIQRTITNGIRLPTAESHESSMPAFGTDRLLTRKQIEEVADYVMSIAKSPAVGSAGEAIYGENCAACHGDRGEGSANIGAPHFTKYPRFTFHKTNREGVIAQVTNPMHGTCPSPTAGGKLDVATIKMLTVYIHNLGGGR